MRKILLSVAGAAAISMASAASATITITACDPNLTSCVADNSGAPAQSTIAYTDANVPSGAFSSTIDFTNTLAGNYYIVLQSSTPFFLYSTLTISPLAGPPAGSGSYAYGGAPGGVIGPVVATLGTGTFRLTFGGTSPRPNGGASSGNITFQFVPVPEPATWGLMLLGFAGIGLAMRRGRRPALAQVV